MYTTTVFVGTVSFPVVESLTNFIADTALGQLLRGL